MPYIGRFIDGSTQEPFFARVEVRRFVFYTAQLGDQQRYAREGHPGIVAGVFDHEGLECAHERFARRQIVLSLDTFRARSKFVKGVGSRSSADEGTEEQTPKILANTWYFLPSTGHESE